MTITKEKRFTHFFSLQHRIAITQLAIEVDLQNRHHLMGTEEVAEQNILLKCQKCSHFGVTSKLHILAINAIIHLDMASP